MIRNSLATRATVAAVLLAFATLPALAQSMTPAAPTPAAGANTAISAPAVKANTGATVKPAAQKKAPVQKQVKQTKPAPVKQQVQAKQPAPAAGAPATGGTSAASVNGNATVNH